MTTNTSPFGRTAMAAGFCAMAGLGISSATLIVSAAKENMNLIAMLFFITTSLSVGCVAIEVLSIVILWFVVFIVVLLVIFLGKARTKTPWSGALLPNPSECAVLPVPPGLELTCCRTAGR